MRGRLEAQVDAVDAVGAAARVEALARAETTPETEEARAKRRVARPETTPGVREAMVGWAVKLVGWVGLRELGALG